MMNRRVVPNCLALSLKWRSGPPAAPADVAVLREFGALRILGRSASPCRCITNPRREVVTTHLVRTLTRPRVRLLGLVSAVFTRLPDNSVLMSFPWIPDDVGRVYAVVRPVLRRSSLISISQRPALRLAEVGLDARCVNTKSAFCGRRARRYLGAVVAALRRRPTSPSAPRRDRGTSSDARSRVGATCRPSRARSRSSDLSEARQLAVTLYCPGNARAR